MCSECGLGNMYSLPTSVVRALKDGALKDDEAAWHKERAILSARIPDVNLTNVSQGMVKELTWLTASSYHLDLKTDACARQRLRSKLYFAQAFACCQHDIDALTCVVNMYGLCSEDEEPPKKRACITNDVPGSM
jgi:hypothetical protein